MQVHLRLNPLSLALTLLPLSALAQTALEPPSPTASAPTRSAPQKPAARQQAKPAGDAPANEKLERVEITGGASDDTVRRMSTASKIVVTREEIERFGDSTLGEVLKRLPGVTSGGRPGRGGDVRMRGMGGGYTQILVNGERMPPGFSLDQLPPEQVERIEVLRAPTAEHGARAVAGTINVVLREALQRHLNEVRTGLGVERGHVTPALSWSRNDKLDERGGAYNLTLNAMKTDRVDDVHTIVSTEDLAGHLQDQQTTLGQSAERRQALNLTGRLQWRLGEGDNLSIQPFAVVSKSGSSSQITQTPGRLFDAASTSGDNKFTMLRLNSQWQKRVDENTRLELRGGFGGAQADGHSLRQESLAGAATRTLDDTSSSRDRSYNLVGKLSRQLESEHSLVGGIEAEGNTRDSSRTSLQNGLPRPELADFGDNLKASTQRLAVYGQDEWELNKQWSFYAGLRWEGITTKSDAANYAVSNRSSVWTPLLHAVWKLDEKSRDQLRMSLTRSYRSPQLNDLIARPSINNEYPCPLGQLCGPNQIQYADRAGNPGLKPELATGLEIGFEHYLSKGGLLSANVFYRQIHDLIRTQTNLETVSWALPGVQRWVSRPSNIGEASTAGIELEAKFRLDEFISEAWPVNVRSNLSLFHSNVDGIPGPNNKLDQQPRATANLGADYRLRNLPLSVGASLNWTPANTVQESLLQANSTPRKLVTDAFVSWNINMNTLLRLSASNLNPLDYNTASLISTDTQRIQTDNLGRTFTNWQLRLEIKL
ncbi:TonB-dependent receptor [Paucibacter sp. APW11]|uniref:TonB-dependent receptor n=1 Tax=Roseateles aquae TaxID=3077235 RepID=A0ABU3PDL8_9BURK|nr:TonB-dependent receptor [Paucibacter sp. APW11]MDT9000425.1 TonB-dependent receptor [Paucibacter sp. APW11]